MHKKRQGLKEGGEPAQKEMRKEVREKARGPKRKPTMGARTKGAKGEQGRRGACRQKPEGSRTRQGCKVALEETRCRREGREGDATPRHAAPRRGRRRRRRATRAAETNRTEPPMGGCVGSRHDSSGSLNDNSDGTGGNFLPGAERWGGGGLRRRAEGSSGLSSGRARPLPR